MLGPVDIEDWSAGEEERLRAEIRLLPLVQRFNRQPQQVAREIGRDMARRLEDFAARFDQPVKELDALLTDLKRTRPV